MDIIINDTSTAGSVENGIFAADPATGADFTHDPYHTTGFLVDTLTEPSFLTFEEPRSSLLGTLTSDLTSLTDRNAEIEDRMLFDIGMSPLYDHLTSSNGFVLDLLDPNADISASLIHGSLLTNFTTIRTPTHRIGQRVSSALSFELRSQITRELDPIRTGREQGLVVSAAQLENAANRMAHVLHSFGSTDLVQQSNEQEALRSLLAREVGVENADTLLHFTQQACYQLQLDTQAEQLAQIHLADDPLAAAEALLAGTTTQERAAIFDTLESRHQEGATAALLHTAHPADVVALAQLFDNGTISDEVRSERLLQRTASFTQARAVLEEQLSQTERDTTQGELLYARLNAEITEREAAFSILQDHNSQLLENPDFRSQIDGIIENAERAVTDTFRENIQNTTAEELGAQESLEFALLAEQIRDSLHHGDYQAARERVAAALQQERSAAFCELCEMSFIQLARAEAEPLVRELLELAAQNAQHPEEHSERRTEIYQRLEELASDYPQALRIETIQEQEENIISENTRIEARASALQEIDTWLTSNPDASWEETEYAFFINGLDQLFTEQELRELIALRKAAPILTEIENSTTEWGRRYGELNSDDAEQVTAVIAARRAFEEGPQADWYAALEAMNAEYGDFIDIDALREHEQESTQTQEQLVRAERWLNARIDQDPQLTLAAAEREGLTELLSAQQIQAFIAQKRAEPILAELREGTEQAGSILYELGHTSPILRRMEQNGGLLFFENNPTYERYERASRDQRGYQEQRDELLTQLEELNAEFGGVLNTAQIRTQIDHMERFAYASEWVQRTTLQISLEEVAEQAHERGFDEVIPTEILERQIAQRQAQDTIAQLFQLAEKEGCEGSLASWNASEERQTLEAQLVAFNQHNPELVDIERVQADLTRTFDRGQGLQWLKDNYNASDDQIFTRMEEHGVLDVMAREDVLRIQAQLQMQDLVKSLGENTWHQHVAAMCNNDEDLERIGENVSELWSRIRSLNEQYPEIVNENNLHREMSKIRGEARRAVQQAIQDAHEEDAWYEVLYKAPLRILESAVDITVGNVAYYGGGVVGWATGHGWEWSDAGAAVINFNRGIMNDYLGGSVLGTDEQLAAMNYWDMFKAVNPVVQAGRGIGGAFEGLELGYDWASLGVYNGTGLLYGDSAVSMQEFREIREGDALLRAGKTCFHVSEACFGLAITVGTGTPTWAVARQATVTSAVIGTGVAGAMEGIHAFSDDGEFRFSRFVENSIAGTGHNLLFMGGLATVGRGYSVMRYRGRIPTDRSSLSTRQLSRLEKAERGSGRLTGTIDFADGFNDAMTTVDIARNCTNWQQFLFVGALGYFNYRDLHDYQTVREAGQAHAQPPSTPPSPSDFTPRLGDTSDVVGQGTTDLSADVAPDNYVEQQSNESNTVDTNTAERLADETVTETEEEIPPTFRFADYQTLTQEATAERAQDTTEESVSDHSSAESEVQESQEPDFTLWGYVDSVSTRIRQGVQIIRAKAQRYVQDLLQARSTRSAAEESSDAETAAPDIIPFPSLQEDSSQVAFQDIAAQQAPPLTPRLTEPLLEDMSAPTVVLNPEIRSELPDAAPFRLADYLTDANPTLEIITPPMEIHLAENPSPVELEIRTPAAPSAESQSEPQLRIQGEVFVAPRAPLIDVTPTPDFQINHETPASMRFVDYSSSALTDSRIADAPASSHATFQPDISAPELEADSIAFRMPQESRVASTTEPELLIETEIAQENVRAPVGSLVTESDLPVSVEIHPLSSPLIQTESLASLNEVTDAPTSATQMSEPSSQVPAHELAALDIRIPEGAPSHVAHNSAEETDDTPTPDEIRKLRKDAARFIAASDGNAARRPEAKPEEESKPNLRLTRPEEEELVVEEEESEPEARENPIVDAELTPRENPQTSVQPRIGRELESSPDQATRPLVAAQVVVDPGTQPDALLAPLAQVAIAEKLKEQKKMRMKMRYPSESRTTENEMVSRYQTPSSEIKTEMEGKTTTQSIGEFIGRVLRSYTFGRKIGKDQEDEFGAGLGEFEVKSDRGEA